VLNRDSGEPEEDENTLEERIEEDRHKLEHDKCTPVTKESFA